MDSQEALTQAQRLIVHMSPEHQQKLIQAIKALNQLKGAPITLGEGVPTNDWTLVEIAEILTSREIEFTSPATLARRCPSISSYREKAQSIDKFLSVVPQIQQRALFRLGIMLLCQNLSEMNIPVSGLSIMNHIHRMPSLIDRAFPGYARLGLLGMIIRKNDKIKKDKSNGVRKRKARAR